ncbi:unnamed protein product, partial [Polarella glacialis]
ERISKYPLPGEARDTQQSWWPKALELLQNCLEMESRGELSTNKLVSLTALDGEAKAEASSRGAGKASLGAKAPDERSSERPQTGGSGRALASGTGDDKRRSGNSLAEATSMLDFAQRLRPVGCRRNGVAAGGEGT